MPPTEIHPAHQTDLQVHRLDLYSDNYAWLLYNQDRAWIIDPGQAEPVQSLLETLNVTLNGMLITHCHWDHVSGVEALNKQHNLPVYGTLGSHPSINTAISEGDTLSLANHRFEVWQTPGHMADHLSFYYQQKGWLFCGDTLFSAGCGRLKQTGNLSQLFNSVQRFKTLPGSTKVFCSHEYTQKNLAFAAEVEPSNAAIKTYQQTAANLRACHKPTIPSTIEQEIACNPFLRLEQAEIIAKVAAQTGHSEETLKRDPFAVFAALRKWKDVF
ncbi:MAG TPA: hydroxyacylglutathione hydrolase [Marinagarivorans sp.]